MTNKCHSLDPPITGLAALDLAVVTGQKIVATVYGYAVLSATAALAVSQDQRAVYSVLTSLTGAVPIFDIHCS